MGTPAVIEDVVAKVNSSDAQVQEACDSIKPGVSIMDKIFHQLSDDEKERAARASSYRYLVASISPTQDGAGERDKHAKAMIQRFVIVEQKLRKNKSPEEWEAASITKLRSTLKFREERQADDILLCFDKDKLSDDKGLHATIREGLEERFATKASIVRGYTKDGHAMFQCFGRADTSWSEEYYLKGMTYMFERALACTERKTNGEKDKIVFFYDYNEFGLRNTPPPMLVKKMLFDVRDHWPERVQHSFIVDAPFAFRAFWAIVKHFIDPITKETLQFITGEEQKKIFREMISEDQAAPFMFDGAKDWEEADMKAFFYDTPFDSAYGEELPSS